MPLATSGNSGGDAVAAAIAGVAVSPGTPVTDAQLKLVWEAAITALYANIVSNAVVETTDVGEVTTGVGIGGTVTGTGIGTVE